MPNSSLPSPTRRTQSVANIGGRTKQSFKDDANPARLVRQFTKTGDIDVFNQTAQVAMHGDFSAVPDFFTALLQVQEVQEEFMRYPSKMRASVNNDPAQLLELLADPDRVEEAKTLGFIHEDVIEPLPIPLPPDTPKTVEGETPPETT